MKKLWIVGLALLGWVGFAQAETLSPDQMIKSMVEKVDRVFKDSRGNQEADKQRMLQIVDKEVLPLFDFQAVALSAVGPAWRSATPEQKRRIIDEFRTLLVRAFLTKAFANPGERTVNFLPLKLSESGDQAIARTQVMQAGQPPLNIEYMLKKTDGGWKIVDLAVEGSRLAKNVYNAQFREKIQAGGLDGLIAYLVEKNQAAAKQAGDK